MAIDKGSSVFCHVGRIICRTIIDDDDLEIPAAARMLLDRSIPLQRIIDITAEVEGSIELKWQS